jgi:phosphoserine aminotransferase
VQFFYNCHHGTTRGSKLRQLPHLTKDNMMIIRDQKKIIANHLQVKKIFMYFGSDLKKSV